VGEHRRPEIGGKQLRVFWSYARNDDQAPNHKVTKLKDAFLVALRETTGRKDCSVFFDVESIPWGARWRDSVEQEIGRCDGLVAVITPSFFRSRTCIYELKLAFDAGKPTFPIYFRRAAELESSFKEDGSDPEMNVELNETSRRLEERQLADFRPLRNKPASDERVLDFVDGLAEQLVAHCS
jgi:hypothetical protein